VSERAGVRGATRLPRSPHRTGSTILGRGASPGLTWRHCGCGAFRFAHPGNQCNPRLLASSEVDEIIRAAGRNDPELRKISQFGGNPAPSGVGHD
jgi:hypothetical protein